MELECYSCPNCSKVYTKKTYSSYKLHVEKCGTQKFRCEECGNSYLTLDILKNHLKKAHSETSGFVCQTCGREFSEKFRLKEHEKIHLSYPQRKRLSCDHCDKTFAWKASLTRHQQDHLLSSLNLYMCPCGEKFSKYSACYTHKKKCPAVSQEDKVEQIKEHDEMAESANGICVDHLHPSDANGQHKCQFCMAGFSDRQLLADHIDTCDPFINNSRKALTKEAINQMVSKYKIKVKVEVGEDETILNDVNDNTDKDLNSEQLGTITEERIKNSEKNDSIFGRSKRERKMKEFPDYETDIKTIAAKEYPYTAVTDGTGRSGNTAPSIFCMYCKFSDTADEKMREHFRTAHDAELTRLVGEGTRSVCSNGSTGTGCVPCGMKLKSKDDLLNHIIKKHASEPCLTGVGHSSVASSRQQENNHTTLGLVCKVCLEPFPDKKSLQAHKNSHKIEPNPRRKKAVSKNLEKKQKNTSIDDTDVVSSSETSKTGVDPDRECDIEPVTNSKTIKDSTEDKDTNVMTENDTSGQGRSKRKRKMKQFPDFDTEFENKVAKNDAISETALEDNHASSNSRPKRKPKVKQFADYETDFCITPKKKINATSPATKQNTKVKKQGDKDSGVKNFRKINKSYATLETSGVDESVVTFKAEKEGSTEAVVIPVKTQIITNAEKSLIDTGVKEDSLRNTVKASCIVDMIPERGGTGDESGSSQVEEAGVHAKESKVSTQTNYSETQSNLPKDDGTENETSININKEICDEDAYEKVETDPDDDDEHDNDYDENENACTKENAGQRKYQKNIAFIFHDLEYVCTTGNCGQPFDKQKTLSEHKKAVHKEKLETECEECSRTFSTFYVYKSHIRMQHFDSSFIKLAYRNTQLRFSDEYSQQKSEIFVCVKCGAVKPLSRIKEHTCSSTVQMRFFCPYCTCSEMMFTHIQSHIKEAHPGKASSMTHSRKYETLRTASMDMALLKIDETSTDCPKCDQTFSSNSELLAHISMWHVSQPFCCGVCRLAYGRKATLKNHLETHGNLGYTCDECPAQFHSQKALDAHRNVHTGNRPYRCEVCNNRYCEEKSVRKHMQQRHPDAFTEKYGPSRSLQPSGPESEGCVCPSCGQMFKTPQLLNRHMITHKKEAGLQCPDCSRRFESNRQYKDHLRHRRSCRLALKKTELCSQKVSVSSTAEMRRAILEYKIVDEGHASGRPYQCRVCRKRFLRTKMLTQHIQTMHMEDRVKSYICSVCGRGFPRRTMLDVHYRIHTSARPYRCRLCHKSYRQLGHIREHLRAHGKKSYVCKLCGKSFKTIATLSIHIMIHCNIFPFKCPLESCNKTFADVIQLCQHGTICFSEATNFQDGQLVTFVCKFCNRTFPRSEDAISHLSIHENEGMFSCTVCGEQQTSFKQLYFHKDKQGHFLESELEHNVTFNKYVNNTKASRTLEEVDWQYGIEDLMSQYDFIKESSLEPSGSDTLGVASTRLQEELPEEEIVEETYRDEANKLILIAEQLTNMAAGTAPYTDIVLQDNRDTQQHMHGLQTEYEASSQVLVHIQNSASENLGYSTVILEAGEAYEGGLQVVEGGEEFVVKAEDDCEVPASYKQLKEDVEVTVVVDTEGRSEALNTCTTIVNVAEGIEALRSGSKQEGLSEPYAHQVLNIPIDVKHGEDVNLQVRSEHQETLNIPVSSSYVEIVNPQIISTKPQSHEPDSVDPTVDSNSKGTVSKSTIKAYGSLNEQAGHEAYNEKAECLTTIQPIIQTGEVEVEKSDITVLNEARAQEDPVAPISYENKILVKQGDPDNEMFEDCHVDIVRDEKMEMREILESLNVASFDEAGNGASGNDNCDVKVVDVQGNEMSVCMVNEQGEQEAVTDGRDILRSVLQTGRYKVQCSFKQVTTSRDNMVTTDEGGSLMIDMGDNGEQEAGNTGRPNVHVTDVYVVVEKDASESVVNVEQKVEKPQPVARNVKKGGKKGVRNTRKIKGELVKEEDFRPDVKDGFNYKVCLNYYDEKDEVRHPFQCECGKRFARVKDLNAHRKYHLPDSEKKYQCGVCGKGFVGRVPLEVHERSHTGAKPYCCKTCGKTFRQRAHLQVHLRAHLQYAPFKCATCGKPFRTNAHLNKHVITHDPIAAQAMNIHKCDLCKASFALKRDLKLHKFKKHMNKTSQEALLKKCNALEIKTEDVSDETQVTDFKNNNNLIKDVHMCDVCGQTFISESGLRLHRDRHNKGSNFPCSECDKSFATQLLLKEHKRLNHQDKLPCEVCGVQFKTNTSLKNHLLRVHNKGVHKYQCQTCGEKFCGKSMFMRHIHKCMQDVLDKELSENITT